jgi:hypothetical protein
VSRTAFRRPGRTPTPAGRKILICCEGSKTEPHYFNAIRGEMGAPKERLIVLPTPHTDPLGIVTEVRDYRKELRTDGDWGKADTAWAVFDGDEHIQADAVRWHEAIDMARANAISLAITNPSFEYWYLIHFQDQRSNIHRDSAKARLAAHVPGYEKSRVLYPDPLGPLTEVAIARAAVICEEIVRDLHPTYRNPCTYVHSLVSDLRKFARELAASRRT